MALSVYLYFGCVWVRLDCYSTHLVLKLLDSNKTKYSGTKDEEKNI